MTRGYENHQTRGFALSDLAAEALESPTDVVVDPAGRVARVRQLGEVQKAAPRQNTVCEELRSGWIKILA